MVVEGEIIVMLYLDSRREVLRVAPAHPEPIIRSDFLGAEDILKKYEGRELYEV